MAKLLSGREVSASLQEVVKEKVSSLKDKGITPTLCLIRVGENPSDISYEKGALKRCESLGIACERVLLEESVSQEEMLSCIERVNQDGKIHGVLLFRPLPAHLDESVIANALLPEKDVDCMTDLSMAGVFTGKPLGFPPCTAEAVMKILAHYEIGITGKRCVVVGRSLVIGRPVAMMLMKENGTVTICHTRTKDLPSVCREADILVVAAGKPRVLGKESLREGQVVIDVGIHVGEDGKLCGDVSFEEASMVAAAITPVPGGVGAVTTTILASHVAEAAERSLLS